MRFKNNTRSTLYISGVGRLIPLRESRSYDNLKKTLKWILDSGSADIILDKEEIGLIDKLLERNSSSSKRDTSSVKKELKRDVPMEIQNRRDMKERELSNERIRMSREKTKFFEDRKPTETENTIEPKKLDGKPRSLADIINHNAALQ